MPRRFGHAITAKLAPVTLALAMALQPGLAAPAFADTPAIAAPPSVGMADAMDAYEAGDFARALAHARTVALSGNTEAQVMAGHILVHGQAGFVDRVEAAEYFRMAADKGDTDAQVALGELAAKGQAGLTHSDALKWLGMAADAGRTDAMRALASLHALGKGTAPNAKKSNHLLTQAASSGDAKAARAMADKLLETDAKAALEWYEKAAAAGDIEAAYAAAIMYAENFDITPNPRKTAALMGQAAYGGHPAGMADYGLLVFQGTGVKQDSRAAANWFRKAAKAGDPEGQFLYAFTLAKGDGVAQNMEEAYYWLLKSETGKSTEMYDNDRKIFKAELDSKLPSDIISRAKARFAANPG